MNWIPLTSLAQLEKIRATAGERSLLFKHSTRCSVSRMALRDLEASASDLQDISCYYLDLLSYREVSNAIAELFEVSHQSPQVLVVEGDTCHHHASQGEISAIDWAEL